MGMCINMNTRLNINKLLSFKYIIYNITFLVTLTQYCWPSQFESAAIHENPLSPIALTEIKKHSSFRGTIFEKEHQLTRSNKLVACPPRSPNKDNIQLTCRRWAHGIDVTVSGSVIIFSKTESMEKSTVQSGILLEYVFQSFHIHHLTFNGQRISLKFQQGADISELIIDTPVISPCFPLVTDSTFLNEMSGLIWLTPIGCQILATISQHVIEMHLNQSSLSYCNNDDLFPIIIERDNNDDFLLKTPINIPIFDFDIPSSQLTSTWKNETIILSLDTLECHRLRTSIVQHPQKEKKDQKKSGGEKTTQDSQNTTTAKNSRFSFTSRASRKVNGSESNGDDRDNPEKPSDYKHKTAHQIQGEQEAATAQLSNEYTEIDDLQQPILNAESQKIVITSANPISTVQSVQNGMSVCTISVSAGSSVQMVAGNDQRQASQRPSLPAPPPALPARFTLYNIPSSEPAYDSPRPALLDTGQKPKSIKKASSASGAVFMLCQQYEGKSNPPP